MVEKLIRVGMTGLGKLYEKRVMILGATGLIGGHMVEALLDANEEDRASIRVCAVSRSINGLEDRFSKFIGDIELKEADVSDTGVSEILESWKPDVIIHAASASYPAAFIRRPVEILASNIDGTRNLLEYAKRTGDVRMVYVSSGEVRSKVDHTTERACYPVGKLAAETLCLAYHREHGVDTVIARPCHTFGPGTRAEDNHASAQFIRLAAMGQDIVLKSDGTQRRTYAYVEDCVSGILTAMACGESGGIYEVATDEALSIREFAESCAEVAGTRVVYEAPSDGDKRERTNIDEQIMGYDALAELGWSPAYSLRDGIRESVERERKWLASQN